MDLEDYALKNPRFPRLKIYFQLTIFYVYIIN